MYTIKLYDDLPYETKFTANITAVEKSGENVLNIILNKTLFFPESGGQSCDKGEFIIDGSKYPVLHVSIDNEGIIRHIINADYKIFHKLKGIELSGEIDWNHRFSNMQQHSGEHIFSGLVKSHFGFDNIGFHLSDNIVTMDYSGFLSNDDVTVLERLTNEAIIKNIEIICRYPSEDELKIIDYRSKGELSGPVRIVSIPGIDDCACCCPHVKRTGEIGILKVISSIKYKGGVRLSILCGFRALNSFSEFLNQAGKISRLLSSEKELLISAVSALKNERDEYKFKVKALKEKLLDYEVEKLSTTSLPLIFVEETDVNYIRKTVNMLASSFKGYCGIFSGNDEAGYSYIISSKDSDCRELQNELNDKFSAKGGGGPEMVQGALRASKKEITDYISSL